MNTFRFIAAFSALVLAVSASPVKNEPREQEIRSDDPPIPHNDFFAEIGCSEPGSLFYDRCNLCTCGPRGESAGCTDMQCLPSDMKSRLDGYKQGQACPAGKTFYDECNTCTCAQDGVSAVCTLMDCANKAVTRKVSRPSLPHIDNFSEAQECTPGLHFYDRCNMCSCAKDGKSAACTLMACGPVKKIRIDDYVAGMKCPAGQTFYNRCNACYCSTDGLSAACTLKACPEYN